jgi:hypothetical protein
MSQLSKRIDALVQPRILAAEDAAVKQALESARVAVNAFLKEHESFKWRKWLARSRFGGILGAAAAGGAIPLIAWMQDWVTLLHVHKNFGTVLAGAVVGAALAALQNWRKYYKPPA